MKSSIVVLLVLLLSGCIYVNVPLQQGPAPAEEKVVEGRGPAKIAVLDLSGRFTSTSSLPARLSPGPSILPKFKEELQLAQQDPDVAGVVLRIDSPGGSVTISDILFHEIKRFRESKQVPVIACVMDRAYSGGYYVALGAEEIFAHPTSTVGAIGVISLNLDISGLLEKWGIDIETIKSGRFKDSWSPLRKSLPEERSRLQRIVDRMHERFIALLRQNREISSENVAEISKGGIFGASRALEMGLVDQTGYVEDAIDRVQQIAGLDDARVVIYRQPGTVAETLYSSSSVATSLRERSVSGLIDFIVEKRFNYLFLR